MALGDNNFRIPPSFAGQNAQMFQQAAQGAPAAYAQYQQSRDADYTAPGAEASPHSQLIGQHIQRMMDGPPEFQARLRAELAGQRGPGAPQGLAAPGPQGPQAPQGQYTGPMASANVRPSVQNQGPGTGPWAPDWTQGRGSGLSAPMPETNVTMGPPQQPEPYSQQPQNYGQGAQGPGRVQLTQAASGPGSAPQGQGAGGPMTNADVGNYMHMAPFLKANKSDWRQEAEANKLGEKKRQFDAMMEYRNKSLGQKKDIAAMMDQTRRAANDTDRKAAIAQAKMALDKYKADIGLQGRMLSGLTGIVNDEATSAAIKKVIETLMQDASEIDQWEAEIRATEGESVQAKPGHKPQVANPGGGGTTIRVRVRSTGEPGTIPANEFDAKLYEKVTEKPK